MLEEIYWSLADERKLAAKIIKRPRIFKLTWGGQWEKQSLDGKYNPLNATRLLRRLQMAISKHARRMTTE